MSARRKRARSRKPGDNRPSALGYSQFAWIPREMLESPAFRNLSVNAFRLFFAIWVENLAHAGTANGQLICTHEQLKAYGLSGSKIREAIDELEAFGFIRVRRGGRRALSNQPSRYGIAYLWAKNSCGDLISPKAPWRTLDPSDVLAWKRERSTSRKARARWKRSRTSPNQK
jgi:hypothetical protein